MKVALTIVFTITMIDELFQFRYTLKRDRQLSASGEAPLGMSTYYMMLSYVLICAGITGLGLVFLPDLTQIKNWVFLLITAGMYVLLKLVATFVQTLFVFLAIRKKEHYYKKLKKDDDKRG